MELNVVGSLCLTAQRGCLARHFVLSANAASLFTHQTHLIHEREIAFLAALTPFTILFFLLHLFIPFVGFLSSFSSLWRSHGRCPPHNRRRQRRKKTNQQIPFINCAARSPAQQIKEISFLFLCWLLPLLPREVFSFQRNSINFINLISFPFNTFPWGPLPVNKGNSISPSILKEWAAMNFSFVEWAGPLIN